MTLAKRVQAAVVVGAAAVAMAGLAGPAAAEPTSKFGRYTGSSGTTEGTITWLNRAVNVKGYVSDFVGGPTTTVTFFFKQGDNVISGPESRYVDSDKRDINFSEPGPVGGITGVEVWLCNNSESCVLEGTIKRP
nr:hypothetical protein [Kibdelosporangium sp. MJ126-NF4]CEL21767.1 hypothetical protein [Kibdelosporangium sp. MJ126-NF4]CTQ92547.1 hypothetical protein [Kibdelosporangium sp. MJ126-NF4]